jgi:hypothetical protein
MAITNPLPKCDGGQPCKSCAQRSLDCAYSGRDKRTKSERSGNVKNLQLEVETLRAALKVFAIGSDAEAWSALQQLRNQAAQIDSVQEVFLQPELKLEVKASPLPKLSEPDLISVLADINARQSERNGSVKPMLESKKLYSKDNLPPRDFAERGSRVLFQVIAGLFHVMTAEEFESLIARIYSGDATKYDDSDIAELCALGAVGCQYVPEASNDVKDLFLESALRHINHLVDVDVPRACRVLSCFGGYGVVEKRRSSRILIQLGLELCRNGSEADFGGPAGAMERIKIHRTLLFLDW